VRPWRPVLLRLEAAGCSPSCSRRFARVGSRAAQKRRCDAGASRAACGIFFLGVPFRDCCGAPALIGLVAARSGPRAHFRSGEQSGWRGGGRPRRRERALARTCRGNAADDSSACFTRSKIWLSMGWCRWFAIIAAWMDTPSASRCVLLEMAVVQLRRRLRPCAPYGAASSRDLGSAEGPAKCWKGIGTGRRLPEDR